MPKILSIIVTIAIISLLAASARQMYERAAHESDVVPLAPRVPMTLGPAEPSLRPPMLLSTILRGKWSEIIRIAGTDTLAKRPPRPIAPAPLPEDHPASSLPRGGAVAPASGTVKSVATSSLILSTPLGDATVPLTSDTKYYRLEAVRDAATVRREMNEFHDRTGPDIAGADPAFVAPDPFREIPISLDDIHVGDTVMVPMTDEGAAFVYLVSAGQ